MNTRVRTAAVSAGLIAAVMLGSTALAFAAKSTLSSTAGTTAQGSTATTSTVPPGGPPSGREGHGGRGGRGGMFGVGLVEVVAKLTGETTTTVMTARQSGKSFAEIASAEDISVDEIVELAMHAPEAAAKTQVADGLIKQAEADTMLSDLEAHLTEEVNSTQTRGPGDGVSGHRGPPSGGPATDQSSITDDTGTAQ